MLLWSSIIYTLLCLFLLALLLSYFLSQGRFTLLTLTLSRATSHFCTNRAPLERAMSHYCTTGSGVFFTAHLDSDLSRFSVCCSSTAFLVILLCYYISIFTPVTMAVHKTLPFYPEYLLRCINALRDATNNAYL